MKNVIVLLLSILVFERVNCQTAAVPEWYLNRLFTSMQCGNSPRPVGLELMWDSTYSRAFLLKKLKDNGEYKGTAIMYLGMSKDTSLISILQPYVSDPDQQTARVAISAIGTIGGSKSAGILETCWRESDLDWFMTLNIVHNLELICSPSSIPLLNEIRLKFKEYFEKDEKTRIEFNALVEKIEKYNESDSSRIQLIVNGINGLNGGENKSWAYFQIYRSKDKQFLPILRSIQSSLEILPDLLPYQISSDSFPDVNVNAKYDSILRLRLYIGEEQLTGEEEAYLSKKQQLLPLEKRMLLIQQEISRLEPYYKDKYSGGKY